MTGALQNGRPPGSAQAPPLAGSGEEEVVKMSVVQVNALQVVDKVRVASFRGRPMLMRDIPYPHFVPLRREEFDKIAYPILGGISRSRMGDVFAYVGNTAEDLSDNDRYIMFGLNKDKLIWDIDRLEFTESVKPEQAIWRSPYALAGDNEYAPIPFIMSLAGGDSGVYDDIMQSLAPLVMDQKPDGVIWWIGDGANGKSTLMDAIYRIFPGQLSSITVKRLVDGRDTPSLNGTLANVVKESSEGRIEDTEIYKAIGTHENFRVHKFHSQDDMEIRGNIHHIFSGNSVPLFNDKGWSARRRTFIVPFTQRFESDPTFEERTFTKEFFGQLIAEMCRYAVKLRDQGYRYKWSAATLGAKLEYDTDANNAEEYAKELVEQGVIAFDGFGPVRIDYENWCGDNGYVPLGISNLKRALKAVTFERTSLREGVGKKNIYRLKTMDNADLQMFGISRPGLYTTTGFKPEPTTTKVPDFKEEPRQEDEPKKPSILEGKW